jgi:hypothetical protein
MTTNVIDLAAVRSRRAEQAAAREAVKADAIAKAQPQARACSHAPLEPVGLMEAPVPVPELTELRDEEPLEEIGWRSSAHGNPWTRIGRAHIVIFPSRRGEGGRCLRLQYDNPSGRFLKRTWPSAEEAKAWVEANAHTVMR